MKLKVGDNVIVLSGNDKGKTGEILEIIPKENKVLVKGVNIRKKHVKARKQGEESGIISKEYPIDASKVNYYDAKVKKASRIGYTLKEGKKVRISKKTGAEIK